MIQEIGIVSQPLKGFFCHCRACGFLGFVFLYQRGGYSGIDLSGVVSPRAFTIPAFRGKGHLSSHKVTYLFDPSAIALNREFQGFPILSQPLAYGSQQVA